MSETTFPCGCRLAIDQETIMHLYPCRDDCPTVEAIQRSAAKLLPGMPQHDVRTAEMVLGRPMSWEEAEAAKGN
jgi:hypothetical protein